MRNKTVMRIVKYIFLFLLGAVMYFMLEVSYRGWSHWSMFLLGGTCFVCLGSINNILDWNTSLTYQAFLGASIITVLEYITGYIVNIRLQWDVWDYSDMFLNLHGQVCLPFFLIWLVVSVVAIVLDDYLRYYLFNERKPTYRII